LQIKVCLIALYIMSWTCIAELLCIVDVWM